MSDYQHTQRAPWCLLLYGLAAVPLLVRGMLPPDPVLTYVMVAVSLLFIVLAASFHHLTVADGGDYLSVRFGPVPLFRRRVRYEDIVAVEVGQVTWLEGWGIHLSPRGGWVWNIWGWDCVVIHLKGTTLRVGSDDAPRLAGFLESHASGNQPR